MVRLTGPMDVPYAPVAVTRRAIRPVTDPTGGQIAAVGAATTQILEHVRDQQIENEVADAESTTRRQLDELRLEMQNEPVVEPPKNGPAPAGGATTPTGASAMAGGEGPPAVGGKDAGDQTISGPLALAARWEERARAIMEANSQGLTAPMAREAWNDRTRDLLTTERGVILQLGQQRMLEEARAGLTTAIAKDSAMLNDETLPEATRREALGRIEVMIRRAVDRRMLAPDEGARMAAVAHETVTNFERTVAARTQVQTHTDDFWERSHHNFAVAQELARNELSGTMENDVQNALRQRYNDQEAGRTQMVEEGRRRSLRRIEAGDAVTALPDYPLMVESGLLPQLTTAAEAHATGGLTHEAATRHSRFVRGLIENAAMDPGRAAMVSGLNLNLPLSPYQAGELGLTPGVVPSTLMLSNVEDLNAVIALQRELRGEPQASGEENRIVENTLRRGMPTARQVAAAAGVTIQTNPGQGSIAETPAGERDRQAAAEARRTQLAFESYMRMEIVNYIQLHHAPPSNAEIQVMARGALEQSSGVHRDVWFGDTPITRRRFESGFGNRGVNIAYDRMTDNQIRLMARKWNRQERARIANGVDTQPIRTPTHEQIARMFSEEVAGRLMMTGEEDDLGQ